MANRPSVIAVWMSLAIVSSALAQTRSEATRVEKLRNWRSLPSQRNAAPIVLKVARTWATSELRGEPPKIESSVIRGADPLSEEQLAAARAWLAYWRPQLDALDVIEPSMGFDWGEPPLSPFVLQPPDDRTESSLPFVAALLRLDAMVACREGDLDRAWRRAEQLQQFDDAVLHRPAVLAWTASVHSINTQLCEVLTVLARSDGFSEMARFRRDAIHAAALALIDDAPARRRFDHLLEFESGVLEDTMSAFERGALPAPQRAQYDATGSLAGRILATGTREQLEFLSPILETFRDMFGPDEPFQAGFRNSVWKARVEANLRRDVRVRSLARSVAPILAQRCQDTLEFLARRRLAAVTLAIGLYRADHDGRFPESLDALVPLYLPQVPSDPLAASTAPLRYRNTPEPIVWSTGTNGQDDGGRALTADLPPHQRRATDLVIRLR